MSDGVALDSNILVYLAAIARVAEDESKIERVRTLIGTLQRTLRLVAPVQALGELFAVMRRNGRSVESARAFVLQTAETCDTPASDTAAAISAMALVAEHHLQYWDALILSAAAAAGCTLLLSEDMQHGFAVGRVTVVNPLVEPMHPRLAACVSG